MPATTTNFLAAMNGTTHDAANDYAITSLPAGARNIGVAIFNESFHTVPSTIAPYKIGAVAHSILAASGAAPAPGGNGLVLSGATYAVTANEGTGYIEVQQTSA